MADLTSIRDALAAQITAKTGLRADGQARDAASPPCCMILPGNPLITYADTMDGAVSLNLVALVIVSDAPGADRSQAALDAYLGIGAGEAESVPGAIAADSTLGGTVQWCQPVSVGSYGRVEYAGVPMFGARLNVTVGGI